MRPIPTDATRFVVCVSVCLLSTLVSSAKTYELIEMSLKGGRSTHVGQGASEYDRSICAAVAAMQNVAIFSAATCQLSLLLGLHYTIIIIMIVSTKDETLQIAAADAPSVAGRLTT